MKFGGIGHKLFNDSDRKFNTRRQSEPYFGRQDKRINGAKNDFL